MSGREIAQAYREYVSTINDLVSTLQKSNSSKAQVIAATVPRPDMNMLVSLLIDDETDQQPPATQQQPIQAAAALPFADLPSTEPSAFVDLSLLGVVPFTAQNAVSTLPSVPFERVQANSDLSSFNPAPPLSPVSAYYASCGFPLLGSQPNSIDSHFQPNSLEQLFDPFMEHPSTAVANRPVLLSAQPIASSSKIVPAPDQTVVPAAGVPSAVVNKRKHTCDRLNAHGIECGIHFYLRSWLLKHQARTHDAAVPRHYFVCDRCNFGFTEKGTLTKHIANNCGA